MVTAGGDAKFCQAISAFSLENLSLKTSNRYLSKYSFPGRSNQSMFFVGEKFKEGHEAHFARVTEKFLQYLKDGKLPSWEVPNMIAKYYTTTAALEMAQQTKRVAQ